MERLSQLVVLAASVVLVAACGPRDVERAEASVTDRAARADPALLEITVPRDNAVYRALELGVRTPAASCVDIATWLGGVTVAASDCVRPDP